jgi:hypothetical protein
MTKLFNKSLLGINSNYSGRHSGANRGNDEKGKTIEDNL